MPRGDQVARLNALTMDLARTRHGMTAAAIAKRHDVPLRTVYRDLHALEASGVCNAQKWTHPAVEYR